MTIIFTAKTQIVRHKLHDVTIRSHDEVELSMICIWNTTFNETTVQISSCMAMQTT